MAQKWSASTQANHRLADRHIVDRAGADTGTGARLPRDGLEIGLGI